jgi:hypothetical protein
MALYRAYKVVDFNRSQPPIEIEADSDSEAIRKAEQYVDGADILLWEGTRFVITLRRKTTA